MGHKIVSVLGGETKINRNCSNISKNFLKFIFDWEHPAIFVKSMKNTNTEKLDCAARPIFEPTKNSKSKQKFNNSCQ